METSDSTTDKAPKPHPPFSQLPREKIYRGLKYFVMLTLVSLTALFYFTSTPETFAALARIDIRFLALAVVLQPEHPEYSVRMTRTWLDADMFGAPICPSCHSTMIEAVAGANRKAA